MTNIIALNKSVYHGRERERLNKIKEDTGCEHCNADVHPYALEFDHIIPVGKKRKAIKTVAAYLKQKDNIQVLCANCHKVKSMTEMLTRTDVMALRNSLHTVRKLDIIQTNKGLRKDQS